jgi:uncharacterized protein (DUF983 family)
MKSRTFLEALVQGRCPKCREGKVFTYPGTHVAKFNVMNETCPHCGVRLEPEPGFYQGAMYVSYAVTVAVIVAVSIVLSVLGDFSEWTYIGIVVAIMILIAPWNYRISRMIYLYLFGGLKYVPRHD